MSITVDYMGETITIPSVPAEYFEVYPYGAIISVTAIGITTFFCVLSESEIFYAPPEFAQEAVGEDTDTLGSLANGYAYCQPGGDSWNEPISKSGAFILHSFIQQEITSWDILWSNHDIRIATGFDDGGMPVIGTEIYFPNSEAPKPPFVLPDGTELPALPEGCFEKYPYGMISYVESTDVEAAYALSVAEGTYIFAPGSATGEGSDYVISLLPGYRHYRYVVAPTAASGWEQYAESTTQHSGHDFSREDGTIEIRWCNHDILTATAMNDDGTPEIGPDLYHKSDVNYRIYGGWLNSMGNQARRLGNVSGELKPGEMESVFSGATLEPLTVTPTTEEQTFTPESPCIGFSSVTVEAAPDTGGGDIVEPETYPSAENVNFGTTSAGKELYTGKYFYGTYKSVNAPVALNPIPALSNDYPYACLAYNYSASGYRLYLTEVPMYKLGSLYGSGSPYISYKYDESTEEWIETGSGTLNQISQGTIPWSNYDIEDRGSGTIACYATNPVPETVEGVDVEYINAAETYTISGATLTALGAVTQQITGIAATNPSAMVSALQMYAGTH